MQPSRREQSFQSTEDGLNSKLWAVREDKLRGANCENKKMHEEEVMKQNQHELGNKLVVVAGGAGAIGERITRMFLQQGTSACSVAFQREIESLGQFS